MGNHGNLLDQGFCAAPFGEQPPVTTHQLRPEVACRLLTYSRTVWLRFKGKTKQHVIKLIQN